MHEELSGWPKRLGFHGFSPALTQHLELAMNAYFGLLIFTLFGFPLGSSVVILCKKARVAIPYISAMSFATLLFHGSFFLLPGRFVSWWFD